MGCVLEQCYSNRCSTLYTTGSLCPLDRPILRHQFPPSKPGMVIIQLPANENDLANHAPDLSLLRNHQQYPGTARIRRQRLGPRHINLHELFPPVTIHRFETIPQFHRLSSRRVRPQRRRHRRLHQLRRAPHAPRRERKHGRALRLRAAIPVQHC